MNFNEKVATSNIKHTLSKSKGRVVVNQALREGASVHATQEVKNVEGFYPRGWVTLENKDRHKAEAKISYDSVVWGSADHGWHQLSDSKVIPSATRYAMWAELIHKVTGVHVYFVNLHTVAHIDKGGKPGWTSAGRLQYIRRAGKANPLVAVHRDEMKNLVLLLKNLKKKGHHIVVTGDLNVDARNDERVKYQFFPFKMLGKIGFVSNYRVLGFNERPTAGRRYIDYVWVNRNNKRRAKKFGRAKFIDYDVLGKTPTDHRTVVAEIKFGYRLDKPGTN